MSWWSRLRNRGQAEEQLDAELRDHVERLVAQHVRAGTADLPSRRARLLAAVQASLALVCPRRLHRRLSMLAQLLFADFLALPGNRRPAIYGPAALRREQSIAARVERVLDSAQREMTTRKIRDALAEDGDTLTMETLRPALAREVRRSGARVMRARDGVYVLRE